MRTAAITFLCFVASGYAASAQKFSLLPQVGFENSKTTINYNNLGSFAPAGVKFSPQASLRLTYTSRHGDGFFLGVASSRSIINFTFADPESGMNNFITTPGNMQLRLEGGYQFSSKPISLSNKNQPSVKHETAQNRGSCSGWHCCNRSCSGNKTNNNKGSWLRIQPSLGMGFIPGVKANVVTKIQNGQTSYEYRAGNWKTAVVAGSGFEFGRMNTKLFTISVNYFKGIGNLGNQVISSSSGGKSITTNLKSSVSGWNMKVGIPFSLRAKSPVSKRRSWECQQYRPATGQYRTTYRCTRNN